MLLVDPRWVYIMQMLEDTHTHTRERGRSFTDGQQVLGNQIIIASNSFKVFVT